MGLRRQGGHQEGVPSIDGEQRPGDESRLVGRKEEGSVRVSHPSPD